MVLDDDETGIDLNHSSILSDFDAYYPAHTVGVWDVLSLEDTTTGPCFLPRFLSLGLV